MVIPLPSAVSRARHGPLAPVPPRSRSHKGGYSGAISLALYHPLRHRKRTSPFENVKFTRLYHTPSIIPSPLPPPPPQSFRIGPSGGQAGKAGLVWHHPECWRRSPLGGAAASDLPFRTRLDSRIPGSLRVVDAGDLSCTRDLHSPTLGGCRKSWINLDTIAVLQSLRGFSTWSTMLSIISISPRQQDVVTLTISRSGPNSTLAYLHHQMGFGMSPCHTHLHSYPSIPRAIR